MLCIDVLQWRRRVLLITKESDEVVNALFHCAGKFSHHPTNIKLKQVRGNEPDRFVIPFAPGCDGGTTIEMRSLRNWADHCMKNGAEMAMDDIFYDVVIVVDVENKFHELDCLIPINFKGRQLMIFGGEGDNEKRHHLYKMLANTQKEKLTAEQVSIMQNTLAKNPLMIPIKIETPKVEEVDEDLFGEVTPVSVPSNPDDSTEIEAVLSPTTEPSPVAIEPEAVEVEVTCEPEAAMEREETSGNKRKREDEDGDLESGEERDEVDQVNNEDLSGSGNNSQSSVQGHTTNPKKKTRKPMQQQSEISFEAYRQATQSNQEAVTNASSSSNQLPSSFSTSSSNIGTAARSDNVTMSVGKETESDISPNNKQAKAMMVTTTRLLNDKVSSNESSSLPPSSISSAKPFVASSSSSNPSGSHRSSSYNQSKSSVSNNHHSKDYHSNRDNSFNSDRTSSSSSFYNYPHNSSSRSYSSHEYHSRPLYYQSERDNSRDRY